MKSNIILTKKQTNNRKNVIELNSSLIQCNFCGEENSTDHISSCFEKHLFSNKKIAPCGTCKYFQISDTKEPNNKCYYCTSISMSALELKNIAKESSKTNIVLDKNIYDAFHIFNFIHSTQPTDSSIQTKDFKVLRVQYLKLLREEDKSHDFYNCINYAFEGNKLLDNNKIHRTILINYIFEVYNVLKIIYN
jgi:hypothetical protein